MRVDPAVLQGVAGRCRALGQDAGRLIGEGVEAQMVYAAEGLRGWYTKRGLEETLWLWRDDLAGLDRYLGQLADAFVRCATEYHHTDEVSATMFWIGR